MHIYYAILLRFAETNRSKQKYGMRCCFYFYLYFCLKLKRFDLIGFIQWYHCHSTEYGARIFRETEPLRTMDAFNHYKVRCKFTVQSYFKCLNSRLNGCFPVFDSRICFKLPYFRANFSEILEKTCRFIHAFNRELVARLI